MTTTVNGSGMTGGHCVSSVKEELAEVPGVTAVDVDLNSGGISPVTIESTGDLDLQAVTEAVAEAGYSVV